MFSELGREGDGKTNPWGEENLSKCRWDSGRGHQEKAAQGSQEERYGPEFHVQKYKQEKKQGKIMAG